VPDARQGLAAQLPGGEDQWHPRQDASTVKRERLELLRSIDGIETGTAQTSSARSAST
jgi:hypothetical protein